MADQIYYDDSNLSRLFAELDPKQRKRAFRAGFMRTGYKIRRKAVANLRSSGINSNPRLERCIRVRMLRKGKAGFLVSIKGSIKNMYTNHRGLKKPVLPWMETGTIIRYTRKSNARRGFIRQHGFMEKTRAEALGTATEEIRENIKKSVIETAKKYGCK